MVHRLGKSNHTRAFFIPFYDSTVSSVPKSDHLAPTPTAAAVRQLPNARLGLIVDSHVGYHNLKQNKVLDQVAPALLKYELYYRYDRESLHRWKWKLSVGSNLQHLARDEPGRWQPTVSMWVYEETLSDGRLLSQVINTEHENVKYLPGFKLPENVLAVIDLLEAAKDATLFIFVIPHQFVGRICEQLVGHIRSDARAISLIKGLDTATSEGGASDADIDLISSKIASKLSIDVSVLMGANL
eukprot:gene27152-29947_t